MEEKIKDWKTRLDAIWDEMTKARMREANIDGLSINRSPLPLLKDSCYAIYQATECLKMASKSMEDRPND